MVRTRTSGALRRGCVLFAAALLMGACDRAAPRTATMLSVAFDTSRGPKAATLVVSGLSEAELATWRNRSADNPAWASAFHVAVAASDSIAVIGRYGVRDSVLEFTPRFPFDQGRDYVARLDPLALTPGRTARPSLSQLLRLPARDSTPTTRVLRILPSSNVLPANLLRIYIEFSAPMSRGAGLPFVHLIDDKGKKVDATFLPLEGDFWSPDHTRYTLFLDPGRVKTGIKPNVDLGRALVDGRTYTLRVDSTWRDGEGRQLVSSYEKKFRAAPMDVTPINPQSWTLVAPQPSSRTARPPLIVKFFEPLDHGLLRRGLGVETIKGKPVPGVVEVGPDELEVRFVPDEEWSAGEYQLVVLDILEDLAGNRIGRKFEVDLFNRADSTSVPSRTTLPFRVR
jgi:hypothetical protein